MALRVHVCRLADVPVDELRAFPVAGVTWPVIVAYVDGELVAVQGVCPHEDVALAGGTLENGRITCPGHAYEFDLRSGRCLHEATLALRRYPITIVGDELFVDLL